MSDDDGISLRAFADQVGVTCEGVRKAIATGKIPATCVGTKTLRTGKTRPCITDPAEAARHWGQSRDENKVRDKAALSEGGKRGWDQRRDGQPGKTASAPKLGLATPAPDITPPAGDSRYHHLPTVNDSKKRIEHIRAEEAQADWDVKRGRLVDAEQIAAAYEALAVEVANELKGVGSKAKAAIPRLTKAEVDMIDHIVYKSLRKISADPDPVDEDEGDDDED